MLMSNISEQDWFRQEPEDPLDRWRRMKAEREEPQPRERRLDTALPTFDDIDRRIEERPISALHQVEGARPLHPERDALACWS